MAIGGKHEARAAAGMERLAAMYDAASGRWPDTGWWNSANALEASIDYMRLSGDTAHASMIENTFAKNDGNRFLNDFYDDEGWWALAWIKAYDFRGDDRYLERASSIFDDMTRGWDSTCGGGIWWNKAHEKKNAIANELFLNIAARLFLRMVGLGAASSYRDWAQRTWSWFDRSGMINAQSLVNDGLSAQCVNDGGLTFTYNQGVILGGLVALRDATGDDTLLTRARATADAALTHLTDSGGVLHEPNEPDLGADGPNFKGIFVRNLLELYDATNEPRYRDAILANAAALWSRNRTELCAFGGIWSGPVDTTGSARQTAAIDALNAAMRFDVAGTTYQAESGVLHGLAVESTHAGFHGAGYIAGWNRDSQSVDIAIVVPAAGAYDLVLRYAAVDDAVRCVRRNGQVVSAQQPFPRTGEWTNWSTSAVYDVALSAGSNIVTIAFDQAQRSSGWLNLDEVRVL